MSEKQINVTYEIAHVQVIKLVLMMKKSHSLPRCMNLKMEGSSLDSHLSTEQNKTKICDYCFFPKKKY